jgi:hypothetical protein
VIYDGYNVAVTGSVPVQTTSGASKLPFRMEDVINIKKARSESLSKAARKLFQAEMAASE